PLVDPLALWLRQPGERPDPGPDLRQPLREFRVLWPQHSLQLAADALRESGAGAVSEDGDGQRPSLDLRGEDHAAVLGVVTDIDELAAGRRLGEDGGIS